MVIHLSITLSITQTTTLLLEFCVLSFIMSMETKHGSSILRKLLDYRDSCVPTVIMHSFCQLLFGQHASLGQLLYSKQKAKAIQHNTHIQYGKNWLKRSITNTQVQTHTI